MWKSISGAANDEQLFIVAAVSSHCNRSVDFYCLFLFANSADIVAMKCCFQNKSKARVKMRTR